MGLILNSTRLDGTDPLNVIIGFYEWVLEDLCCWQALSGDDIMWFYHWVLFGMKIEFL